jgi:hypothetical protein
MMLDMGFGEDVERRPASFLNKRFGDCCFGEANNCVGIDPHRDEAFANNTANTEGRLK